MEIYLLLLIILILVILTIFKFFGGAREVGRSSILLKDRKAIMLDYGVKISGKPEYPVSVPNVDALVLSHAHLDHSGAVPILYNESYIPAFGTEPTAQLSELLLKDALKVARKEHMIQKYHKRSISTFLNRYTSMDYHSTATIGDMEITLYDAGHICGSAITLINRPHSSAFKRVVYTGDFKLRPQYLHKGAEAVKADVLIMESTYANREHPDRDTMARELAEKIKGIIDGNGSVLMPVFAVGRSQEIIMFLHKYGLSQYAYVDGMCRSATAIVAKNGRFVEDPKSLNKAIDETMTIADRHDREDALQNPSIIVTTAGMLNGGPVLDYITRLKKNSEIILTGYQVHGTNGQMLMEKGEVVIDGRVERIGLPVSYYDMSAHAGKHELYEYVKLCGPEKVICVHGDNENAAGFAEKLKLEGYDAVAPAIGETVRID